MFFLFHLGQHEAPGPFATGFIVKRYTSGQTIDVQVAISKTFNEQLFFDSIFTLILLMQGIECVA